MATPSIIHAVGRLAAYERFVTRSPRGTAHYDNPYRGKHRPRLQEDIKAVLHMLIHVCEGVAPRSEPGHNHASGHCKDSEIDSYMAFCGGPERTERLDD